MERALERLARQLLSYDEASLMALWEKYYERVQRFEPTRKWEEAVIVLNLIQAVHWKNLLFNTKWAGEKSLQPSQGGSKGASEERDGVSSTRKGDPGKQPCDSGKVIRFPNPDEDESKE